MLLSRPKPSYIIFSSQAQLRYFIRPKPSYAISLPKAQLCHFLAQSPAMLFYRPKPSYAILSPKAQPSRKSFLVFPCFEASAELQASKASLPI